MYVAVALLLSAQDKSHNDDKPHKMTPAQTRAYACGSIFESILSSSDTLRTKKLISLYVNLDCREYSEDFESKERLDLFGQKVDKTFAK